jgi:iron complex outermembrane recepter protein
VWYPALIGSAFFEQERERRGGLIDIQWAATDDLMFNLSAFTSEMDAANYNRNYLLWGRRILSQGTGQAPDPGYVVRNGTLVSASFAAIPGNVYGVYDQISRPDASSDSSFVDLDVRWDVTDALSLNAKLGTTQGHGKTPTQNIAEWDVGIGAGAAYSLNGIDRAADWSLGTHNTSSNVGDTLDWVFGDQNTNVKDDEQWAQLDAAYSLGEGVLSSLDVGVRYADHSRESKGVVGQGPLNAFNPSVWPQGFNNYPGDFADGLGGTFPRDIWYFSPGQLDEFNDAHTNRDPVTRRNWNSEFLLEEENSAAFAQLNFGGERWNGDIGLRFVRTEEHVVANVAANAATPGAITTSAFGPFVPTTFDNTYEDWLPSANLKFDVTDDLVARLAASKTMTRPDYSSLAGPISLNQPTGPGIEGSGSGSNPNLEPVRSTNVDATLEWYFAPRALLSASVFYMDLTSLVTLGQVRGDFLTFNQAFPDGFVATYVLSVPVNGSGTVKGFEFAYEQPIAEFFGISANYTYADGEEDGGLPLLGTSKNTYNLGAYFENDRFNARVSYTYRSEFYSGLDRLTAFSQDEVDNVSASLGWRITPSFNVTLDALNLNNPTLRYFALNEDQPRSIYQSGRQYYLNAHYKF